MSGVVPPVPADPLVTVMVVNHDYERFVGEAIESALAQTYPRVQVLVVDDGSTDGSRAVVEAFGDRVDALFKPNGGQGSAVNAGMERVRGDVVITLDSDDLLGPTVVEKVVAAFRRDPAAVRAHWRLDVVDADGRSTGRVMPPWNWELPEGDLRPHYLRHRSYVWPPTSGNAWSTAALRRVLPMPEGLFHHSIDRYLSDTVTVLGTLVRVDEIGGAYRVHGSNNYAKAGRPAAWFHRRLAITEVAHDAARRVAQEAGVAAPRPRSTDVLDPAHHGWRLASLKLDRAAHPLPGDRVPVVAVRGAYAALRQPGHPLRSRVQRSLWFLGTGLTPSGGRLARRAVATYYER